MYKTLVVAANTAHEALRQPLFYILVLSFGGMIWSSQFFIMFTLDDLLEGFLLREMGVSSIALCSALLAVLLSWLVITREMERLTALTVLSKPVTRTQFLLGKFLGIFGAVVFADAILATVLVMTIWQKEAGPRLEELQRKEVYFSADFKREETAEVDSVKLNEERPGTATVRLKAAVPLDTTPFLGGLFGVPPEGPLATGRVMAWRGGDPKAWWILSSTREGSITKLLIGAAPDWRDTTGEPLNRKYDPSLDTVVLPTPGERVKVSPSRASSIPLHTRDFWTRELLQTAKACFLAAGRIGIILAFAVAFAPHASLVVNGALCFLLFLLGHVSNYIYLALAERGMLARAAGRFFYTLLPNLENSRVESLFAAGREISLSYVLWTTAYGVAYTALVLVAGTAVFARKEIR